MTLLPQTTSIPAPVSSWPALVFTGIVGVFGTSAVLFFVIRATFERVVIRALESEDNEPLMDRIVVNALVRNPARLREQVDRIYEKEILEREATALAVDENTRRLSWIDGQIQEQSKMLRDQITSQGTTTAGALAEMSANMREMARDLKDTSETMADIKGFLRGSGWNGDERRRRES